MDDIDTTPVRSTPPLISPSNLKKRYHHLSAPSPFFLQCPKGTYREQEKGRGVEDCAPCPVNTYQNTTGATAETDCIRCPDGFFAELEGTAECTCMTEDSCSSEWQNYQRDSMPYVGRQ